MKGSLSGVLWLSDSQDGCVLGQCASCKLRTSSRSTACLKASASCPFSLMFSREMFLKRPDNIQEFAAGE